MCLNFFGIFEFSKFLPACSNYSHKPLLELLNPSACTLLISAVTVMEKGFCTISAHLSQHGAKLAKLTNFGFLVLTIIAKNPYYQNDSKNRIFGPAQRFFTNVGRAWWADVPVLLYYYCHNSCNNDGGG